MTLALRSTELLMLLLTAGAAVLAAEAWRLSDRRRFRIALSCCLPLIVIAVGLIWLDHDAPHQGPAWGFEANWRCLAKGICVRDPRP